MFYPYKKESQAGVHTVTNTPVRVIVDYTFSLIIPAGLTYTADQDKTCVCDDLDNHFLFQAQKSNNVDFSKAENSSISITIDSAFVIGAYGIDKSTIKYLLTETIAELAEIPKTSLKEKKSDKNMILLLHHADAGHYQAFLITAQSTAVYLINIAFIGRDPDVRESDRSNFVNDLLNSIDIIFMDEVPTAEKLQELDLSFKETFKSPHYVTLDKNVRFPIPSEYVSYENSGDNILAVVPSNYDTSSLAFSPKLGYTVLSSSETPIQYSRMAATQVLQTVLDSIEQAMPSFMPSNLPIITAKLNDKGIIVYQYGLNNDRTRYNTSALVYSGKRVYIMSFAITVGKTISRAKIEWDINRILYEWFNQILFLGETAPKDVKSVSAKSSSPASPTRKTELRSTNQKKSVKTSSENKSLVDQKKDVSPVSQSYFPKFTRAKIKPTDLKLFQKLTERDRTEEINGCDLRMMDVFDYIRNTKGKDDTEKAKAFWLFWEPYYKTIDDPSLVRMAIEYAKVFRVNDDCFDPQNDREAEIHNGIIKRASSLFAFRSFVFTLEKYLHSQKIDISSLIIEQILAVADFVDDCGGYNIGRYTRDYAHEESVNSLLHGHANELLNDPSTRIFNGLSTKLLYSHESFSPYCQIRKDNIKPLWNELNNLATVMKGINTYLSDNHDKTKQLTGTLADVLAVWCTFVLAARRSFVLTDEFNEYKVSRYDGDDSLPEITSSYSLETRDDFLYCDRVLLQYVGKTGKARLPRDLFDRVDRICTNRINPSKYNNDAKHFFWLDGVIELVIECDLATLQSHIPALYYSPIRKIIVQSPCEEIPKDMFDYMDGLQEIILPEGLKTIREGAFARNEDAENLCVTIPKSVTMIEDDPLESEECGYPDRRRIEFIIVKGSYAESFFTEYNKKNPKEQVIIHVVQSLEQFAEEKRKKEEAERQRKLAEQRRQEEERRHREEEQRRREEEARRLAAQREEAERRHREEEQRRREEEAHRLAAQKEEAERRLAAQKREYQALLKKKEEAEKEIAENKGLFGEKAKRRKAAKERLAEIEAQMEAFDPAAKQ